MSTSRDNVSTDSLMPGSKYVEEDFENNENAHPNAAPPAKQADVLSKAFKSPQHSRIPIATRKPLLYTPSSMITPKKTLARLTHSPLSTPLPERISSVIKEIKEVLSTKKTNWERRKSALITLQSLADNVNSNLTVDEWEERILPQLTAPLAVQLTEIRSNLIIEVCKTIRVIVDRVKTLSDNFMADLVDALCLLSGQSTKCMATAGESCLFSIIKYALPRTVHKLFLRSETERHPTVRSTAVRCLAIAVEHWPNDELEPFIQNFMASIKKQLSGAAPATRRSARMLYENFQKKYPKEAAEVHRRLSPQVLRQMQRESKDNSSKRGKRAGLRDFLRKRRSRKKLTPTPVAEQNFVKLKHTQEFAVPVSIDKKKEMDSVAAIEKEIDSLEIDLERENHRLPSPKSALMAFLQPSPTRGKTSLSRRLSMNADSLQKRSTSVVLTPSAANTKKDPGSSSKIPLSRNPKNSGKKRTPTPWKLPRKNCLACAEKKREPFGLRLDLENVEDVPSEPSALPLVPDKGMLEPTEKPDVDPMVDGVPLAKAINLTSEMEKLMRDMTQPSNCEESDTDESMVTKDTKETSKEPSTVVEDAVLQETVPTVSFELLEEEQSGNEGKASTLVEGAVVQETLPAASFELLAEAQKPRNKENLHQKDTFDRTHVKEETPDSINWDKLGSHNPKNSEESLRLSPPSKATSKAETPAKYKEADGDPMEWLLAKSPAPQRVATHTSVDQGSSVHGYRAIFVVLALILPCLIPWSWLGETARTSIAEDNDLSLSHPPRFAFSGEDFAPHATNISSVDVCGLDMLPLESFGHFKIPVEEESITKEEMKEEDAPRVEKDTIDTTETIEKDAIDTIEAIEKDAIDTIETIEKDAIDTIETIESGEAEEDVEEEDVEAVEESIEAIETAIEDTVELEDVETAGEDVVAEEVPTEIIPDDRKTEPADPVANIEECVSDAHPFITPPITEELGVHEATADTVDEGMVGAIVENRGTTTSEHSVEESKEKTLDTTDHVVEGPRFRMVTFYDDGGSVRMVVEPPYRNAEGEIDSSWTRNKDPVPPPAEAESIEDDLIEINEIVPDGTAKIPRHEDISQGPSTEPAPVERVEGVIEIDRDDIEIVGASPNTKLDYSAIALVTVCASSLALTAFVLRGKMGAMFQMIRLRFMGTNPAPAQVPSADPPPAPEAFAVPNVPSRSTPAEEKLARTLFHTKSNEKFSSPIPVRVRERRRRSITRSGTPYGLARE